MVGPMLSLEARSDPRLTPWRGHRSFHALRIAAATSSASSPRISSASRLVPRMASGQGAIRVDILCLLEVPMLGGP